MQFNIQALAGVALIAFNCCSTVLAQSPGHISNFVPYRMPKSYYTDAPDLGRDRTFREQYVGNFYKQVDEGKFQSAEAIYQKAVEARERTSSGVYKACMLVRSMPLEYDWPKLEEKLKGWSSASPTSTLPALLLSSAYINHGYAYRGGGYSSTVSPEARDLFNQYVALAEAAIDAHAVTGAKDPCWQASRIRVTNISSKRSALLKSAIEEALTSFPWLYDIYFESALALAPQYGGSAEMIEALAQSALKRNPNGEGAAIYARIYFSTDQTFEGNPFRNGSAQWPIVKKGFEQIVKDYPESGNLSMFAKLACQAGDLETVRDALVRVGNKLDMLYWTYVDTARIAKCFAAVQ
jgi:hypothetical protein